MQWANGATRAEIARSFEKLAALGERMGGEYALAAACLREKAKGMAAAQLARRNELIVELRTAFYPELSDAAAAKEIDAALRRYRAGNWKRIDHGLTEPPPRYLGTYARPLFWILKASEKPLGREMIRKILAETSTGKIRALPFPKRLVFNSGGGARSESMLSESNVVKFLESSPEFRAAAEKSHARAVAERKALLARIAELDAAANKAAPARRKREAESVAALREAERALKAATDAHGLVMNALSSEHLAYERERREAETALIAGDWPEIEAFVEHCRDEWARARNSLAYQTRTFRNRRANTVQTTTISNGARVAARMAAITESQRQAPDLRLIEDPRALPARIAQIVASWPAIDEPPGQLAG